MSSDDDACPLERYAACEPLHIVEARDVNGDFRLGSAGRRRIGAALKYRERRIDPRMPRAQDLVERQRVGAIELEMREHFVSAVISRVVVGENGLAIGFALHTRQQARPERRDVLDALQSRHQQLAGINDLEMRGARYLTCNAHVDNGACAGEGKAEIDFECRSAALYVTLGEPPRFVGIAGHDRVGGIRRMLAVDVRTRREDPWCGEMIGGDHPTQFDELLLPLARITEARDAVTELSQRQLRIVLDVEVQIDQAWKNGTAGQIHGFGVRRPRHGFPRPDRSQAISLDDDAAVLNRRSARAVDHAYIVENQHSRLVTRRRQNREHPRDSRSSNDPTKRVAHVTDCSV